MKKTFAIWLILCLICAGSVFAAVPQQINYQGYLMDTGGNALDTTVSMTFKLYTDSTAGSLLWTETRPSITVTDGLFNVRLGQIASLGDAVFNNAQVWLGITVGSNSEMTPRSRIVSVGYAYRVGTVDGATGGTISGDVNIAGKANIGTGNVNSGSYAFVAGESDTASGSHSTVGGGYQNAAIASYTTVSGGRGNKAQVAYGTVAGGYHNTVTDDYGFIGSGSNNIADYQAVVVGGDGNSATGNYGVIGSGDNNLASGAYGIIVGGHSNQVTNTYGTIGGGSGNYVGGGSGFVGSGYGNQLITDYTVIGGGYQNTGYGLYGVVGGGQYNWVTDTAAAVCGGESNEAHGRHSFVGGGESNLADSTYSAVLGGFANYATGRAATIGGGTNSYAEGNAASVVGGGGHHASGDYATIAGGYWNNAIGILSSIGGGYYNVAGSHATVAGGCHNKARGDYSVVSGGGGALDADTNSASGDYSIIPGGRRNAAIGDYSFAAGRRAKAHYNGSFVWGDATDADFADSAANQFRVRATGGAWIITDTSPWTGAKLPAGGSAWVGVSDSTKKRNLRLVDTEEILDKIADLPIKQWSYKSQDPSIEHVGPMAQDFWKLFGLGEDSLGISTIDPAGIALAAIQELQKQNLDLRAENAKLCAQNSALEKRMARIELQLQQFTNQKSASSEQASLIDRNH